MLAAAGRFHFKQSSSISIEICEFSSLYFPLTGRKWVHSEIETNEEGNKNCVNFSIFAELKRICRAKLKKIEEKCELLENHTKNEEMSEFENFPILRRLCLQYGPDWHVKMTTVTDGMMKLKATIPSGYRVHEFLVNPILVEAAIVQANFNFFY